MSVYRLHIASEETGFCLGFDFLTFYINFNQSVHLSDGTIPAMLSWSLSY